MPSREGRAPDRRFFAVAFDVTDDRRRRRLVKRLSGWGHRAQYSVFECEVALPDLRRFEAELRAELDLVEDRLALYELCVTCRGHLRRHGAPLGFLEPAGEADGGWFIT